MRAYTSNLLRWLRARGISAATTSDSSDDQQYRELVDHAVFGIYRSSLDGGLITANPALAEMLGYSSPKELLGMGMEALYADPAERAELIERFATAEAIENLEVDWKRADGERITVRLNGRPIRDRQGRPGGFEVIAEDVSRRRAIELALQQSRKMEAVGELTGGIAHDLNNLLTVVICAVDLAESTTPHRSEWRVNLAQARDAALRSRELIERLLSFSRGQEPAVEPLDLARVVARTTPLLRHLLPDNVKITHDLAPELPKVLGHRGAIEQILFNLLTNARDALPGGGVVRVAVARHSPDTCGTWSRPSTRQNGDRLVCLSVSDQGAGMDSETLERLFEPFFSTKKEGEGTGLGMTMVLRLVEQLGGEIGISSTPGAGTTVRVALPAAIVEAPVRS